MKFGKQILAQQIPGWSSYYLDYKALKKIVSLLATSRPSSSPSILATGMRPDDVLGPTSSTRAQPPLWESPATLSSPLRQPTLPSITASIHDDDRGPAFQAHKTAFFFRVERELEKINSFYLQKEAELRLRLETLITKRKAAAQRLCLQAQDDLASAADHVEWRALAEGFRMLDRDLAKLQQFIEINATGFRKILKKWDKRSKSTTKELYIARQVDVMPCFNTHLIAQMADTVATCLLDLSNVSDPILATPDVVLSNQMAFERAAHMSAFHDLESNLRRAVATDDEFVVREIMKHADSLAKQPGGRMHVTRILWKAIIEAPVSLADLMLASQSAPFDFQFVDDINGRTCLHEAAIAGELRLVNICIERGVELDRADAYRRNALHYAAMNGHGAVVRRLLSVRDKRRAIDPCALDMDNYSPLIYSIMNGNLECVRVLLDDERVGVEPAAMTSDLIPLSLACQFGHATVALLLMEHGATSLPNTNGEYPIHLAAREGHADICKLLSQRHACDLPDKYSEWTPLFHAASNGHVECVDVLLEAGCNSVATDENGRLAVFHAAWNGHLKCVASLLTAARALGVGKPSASQSPVMITPPTGLDSMMEGDVDVIPSLSLPPPIMPFRIYGHNYLDKNCLVMVALGSSFHHSTDAAISLASRVVGPSGHYSPRVSPSLRLVITSKPESYSAPYTVLLPARDDNKASFNFQVTSLENLSLEFSVYPAFGYKTIGRAIALPSVFNPIRNKASHVLPIIDHRLGVIGQVSFEVCIISPFKDATLEIGGGIETYWKSNTLPPLPTSRGQHPSSNHTSPSNRSVVVTGSRGTTSSSVVGEFVHVVVQVTRDGVPVVCKHWCLPEEHYTLGIADVSFEQFTALSRRLGKDSISTRAPASASDWHLAIADSLISLDQLFETVPLSFGVSLELAFPVTAVKKQFHLGHGHDMNEFVDAILKCLYNSPSSHVSNEGQRRRIIFSSVVPDICSCLNWKQPNYAVFFASACGMKVPSPAFSGHGCEDDRRSLSVGAASDFARANNLLGILVPTALLVEVPSLISGVKDSGLLLGASGSREEILQLNTRTVVDSEIDASLCGGVLDFIDHSRGIA